MKGDGVDPHDDASARRYLFFQAGGERFGVPVDRVQGAAKLRHVVELPGAPAGYAGLTMVRGEPVGVLDAMRAIGGAGPPASGEALKGDVLILLEGEARALLVQRIESVEEVLAADVEAPPPGRPMVTGCVRSDGEAVQLLDVDAVLTEGLS